MADNDLALNPAWRKRISEIGKDNFVVEEMLRLGFWEPITGDEKKHKELVKKLEQKFRDLRKLRAELKKVQSEIEGLTDVDRLLHEVRQQRIERVRKQREARALQKAEEKACRQAEERRRRLMKPTFLGHNVSAGLRYDDGNDDFLGKRGLPLLRDAADIALAMGVSQGEVSWLSYHRVGSRVDHYARFAIPKRSGGERIISSPKPRMRYAQQWILTDILSQLTPHPAAQAFRPGASIIDNAQAHSGQGIVIRLDIKDFFPSITVRRVKGLFRNLGYNEGVATILALICTESPRAPVLFDGERKYVAVGERQLPQGASTSPAISNLIATRIDKRLTGLSRKLHSEWVYTRYADDMFFSHGDSDIPVGYLIRTAQEIVRNEGFVVHEKKTAIMRQPHRQYVTGLIVNETPRIPRRQLRRFRALLHQCEKKGVDAVTEQIGCDALSHALGYMAFVHMVMPDTAQSIRKKHPWLVIA